MLPNILTKGAKNERHPEAHPAEAHEGLPDARVTGLQDHPESYGIDHFTEKETPMRAKALQAVLELHWSCSFCWTRIPVPVPHGTSVGRKRLRYRVYYQK